MSIQSASNFCSACGNSLLNTAVICPKCGSPTNLYGASIDTHGKSKTAAVLLAVFLGIWSWLYTYELNKKKFWASLIAFFALSIVAAIRIGFAAYQREQGNYPSDIEMVFWGIYAYVWFFSPIGLLFWAIIDNATKPRSFYAAYPKKSLS